MYRRILKVKNVKNLILMDLLVNGSNGIIGPFLSLYMKSVGASLYQIGLVNSIGSVFTVIFSLLIGWLLDKLGPRKIAALAVLLSSLPLAFYPLVTYWTQFIPLSIISSVSVITLISVRDVVITTSMMEHDRASAYGLLSAIMPVGSTLGPVIGGNLSDLYGIRNVFFISFFIKVLSIFFALRITNTSTKHIINTSFESDDKNVSKTLSLRQILSTIYIYLLLRATNAFTGVTYMPIYLTEKMGFTKAMIGTLYSIASPVKSCSLFASGMLINKYGGKRVMLLSAVVSPIMMVLYLQTNNIYLFSSLYLLNAIVNVWQMPILRAMMMSSVSERLGTTAALGTFAFRSSNAFASIICGRIGEIYGLLTLFYFTAAVAAIKVPLILKLKDKKTIDTKNN